MQMYKNAGCAPCAARIVAGARGSAGFTLIEMMAVLVLIGVVMAIVGGRVFQNFQSAQYKAGIAQVHSLEMKVQAYVLDNGSTPQTLNDLVTRPGNASNWNGPYAKPADLKDPFGHQFIYKSPGDHGDFDITFLGKDGAPGGDALNKDTGNWE
jgi:general secretion pathway protein G